MFLTLAEVERLAGGRTQPAAQRRHFTRMGYTFIPDPDGRPLVPRAQFDSPGVASSIGPNYAALDAVMTRGVIYASDGQAQKV